MKRIGSGKLSMESIVGCVLGDGIFQIGSSAEGLAPTQKEIGRKKNIFRSFQKTIQVHPFGTQNNDLPGRDDGHEPIPHYK